MSSRDIVAIILSAAVLLFVFLGVGRSYFPTLAPVKIEILDVWADVITVISGGLIAYISRDK
jgi:cytochrome bd-type quinol oxidase subunit 2